MHGVNDSSWAPCRAHMHSWKYFGGGTADAKCLETAAAGNVTTLHLRLATKLPSWDSHPCRPCPSEFLFLQVAPHPKRSFLRFGHPPGKSTDLLLRPLAETRARKKRELEFLCEVGVSSSKLVTLGGFSEAHRYFGGPRAASGWPPPSTGSRRSTWWLWRHHSQDPASNILAHSKRGAWAGIYIRNKYSQNQTWKGAPENKHIQQNPGFRGWRGWTWVNFWLRDCLPLQFDTISSW